MISDLSEYIFNSNSSVSSVFNVLSPEQQSILEQSCLERKIKKGQLIFKEGEKPIGLIYLYEGSAKVFIKGYSNREQIVRLVKPHMFVGYKALFAEKNHTTSAEAIENCVIRIYPKKTLFSLIDENSRFSKEIIKSLAIELGFNFNRIISLTQKHIRGRLAETLLLVKDIYGFEEDGITLRAKFTRENIAHFSNMTTSNAIRTMKKFTDEKLISTTGRKITLLKVKELEKISKTG
ncbi:MAG: Crp/Fnr family transcriptional regulator [Bacteroidales bacterium]|nr:Crp/Fnr family transcriptional regulator [Bacteroidales bacterium]MBN2819442.1 Crp/Fnr family transcriptional regulator [Bacteroidales bacterium]